MTHIKDVFVTTNNNFRPVTRKPEVLKITSCNSVINYTRDELKIKNRRSQKTD